SAGSTKNIPILASVGAITLFASLCIGQLIRIPIGGQGGGLLASDVALIFCMLSVAIAVLFGAIALSSAIRSFKIYCLLILPFFVYSLVLLLMREPSLGIHSFFIAFLYWARLFA